MSSHRDDHPNLQTLKSFLAAEKPPGAAGLPGSRKELIQEMKTVRDQISKISQVISDISSGKPMLSRRKQKNPKANAMLSHRPSSAHESAADGQNSYRMPQPSARPCSVPLSTRRSDRFVDQAGPGLMAPSASSTFGGFGETADIQAGPQSKVKSSRKVAYLAPHERKELPPCVPDNPVYPIKDPNQKSEDPTKYIYRGAGENGFLRPRGAKTMINFCPSGTLYSHRAGQAHRCYNRAALNLPPTQREMTRTFGPKHMAALKRH